MQILSECVAELLKDYKTRETTAKDALDVFIEHRLRAAAANRPQDMETDEAQIMAEIEAQFPSDLLRRFEIYFKPRSVTKDIGVRELRANQVN